MSSPLERRYRRLLRVLPPWYRRDREDEMVATLLEDREDQLDRGPGLGESLAVLGLAVRTRLAATVPGRSVAVGTATRGIALFGLAITLINAAEHLAMWLTFIAQRVPEPIAPFHPVFQLIGYLAIPATFVTVMLGRIGWARVLGIVALVPSVLWIVFYVRLAQWFALSGEATADLTLWLAVVCLFLTATRTVTRTVRRASPLWWFAGAIATGLGAVYGVVDAGPIVDPNASLLVQFLRDTGPGLAVALGCVAYLGAVRRRFDRAGTGALALAAAALVTLIAQATELAISGPWWRAVNWYTVVAGLSGLLLIFVVVMAVIGIRRYFSLPRRRLSTGLDAVE